MTHVRYVSTGNPRRRAVWRVVKTSLLEPSACFFFLFNAIQRVCGIVYYNYSFRSRVDTPKMRSSPLDLLTTSSYATANVYRHKTLGHSRSAREPCIIMMSVNPFLTDRLTGEMSRYSWARLKSVSCTLPRRNTRVYCFIVGSLVQVQCYHIQKSMFLMIFTKYDIIGLFIKLSFWFFFF